MSIPRSLPAVWWRTEGFWSTRRMARRRWCRGSEATGHRNRIEPEVEYYPGAPMSTRRHFLGAAGASVATALASRAQQTTGPNDRIRLALVGAGGQGSYDTRN